MFSRAQSGGSVDPYLEVVVEGKEIRDPPNLAIAIYEGVSYSPVGVLDANFDYHIFCLQAEVDLQLCTSEDLNKFVFSTGQNTSILYSDSLDLNDPKPVKLPITRTGYYCVDMAPLSLDSTFSSAITWRNAYGELPAGDFSKLTFYASLALYYMVLSALWAFLYFQHRSDILPVQKYLTILLPFLAIEMVVQWAYFDLINAKGSNAGSKALIVLLALFSAFRNSLSLFLLLIVCLGFSVVKPSLGSTMTKCRILAGIHFVFGAIYGVGSMILDPTDAALFALLIILPLSISLSVFYVWILSSLSKTIQDLLKRQQTAKAQMYTRLWRVIVFSILLFFGFIIINSLVYSPSDIGEDFIAKHWQLKWFLIDGWLHMVYLIMVTTILFLWRPTADNRRFAMSEQISQNENEFEIDNTNVDTLDDDDEEANSSRPDSAVRSVSPRPVTKSSPPPYEMSKSNQASNTRNASREELFAVGEDSDDDEFEAFESNSEAGSNTRKRD